MDELDRFRTSVFDFLKEDRPFELGEEVRADEAQDAGGDADAEIEHQYIRPKNQFKGQKYGVGLSIMKKMGYIEGQGLGPNGQGIKEPIEIQVRKPGTGIGASLLGISKDKNEEYDDEEESSDEEYYKDVPKKSFYQIIKELEENDIEVPQSLKDLSDSHSSKRPIGSSKEANVDLLNQLNNINTQVLDIKANLKVLEFNESQEQALLGELSQELDSIKALEDALKVVDISHHESPLDALSNYRTVLHDVSIDNPEVQRLVVLAMQPLVIKLFQDWDPWDLTDFKLLDELIQWKPLISPITSMEGLDYYHSLISSNWLQIVRLAFEEWDTNVPTFAISIIVDWEEVLPREVITNIMEYTILPKLLQSIESWTGLEDGPNIWIFEWIPYLTSTFKDRIINAFTDRYDSLLQESTDGLVGMACYKELCGSDTTFENTMDLRVLPKLVTLGMNWNFQFNRAEINSSIIGKLKQWKPWFQEGVYVKLIQLCICNSWLRSLFHSLNQKDANYSTISHCIKLWYESLSELANVQQQFIKGFDMINKFIETGQLNPVHNPRDKSQYLREICSKEEDKNSRGIPTHKLQVSFKDCVDDYCSEHGLIMTPVTGQASNISEKNMFKITTGKAKGLTCYIEHDVLFVKTPSQDREYTPISLNRVVDLL